MKILFLSLLFTSCLGMTGEETLRFFAPNEFSMEYTTGEFVGNRVYEGELWTPKLTWYLMPREVRVIPETIERGWNETKRDPVSIGGGVLFEEGEDGEPNLIIPIGAIGGLVSALLLYFGYSRRKKPNGD